MSRSSLADPPVVGDPTADVETPPRQRWTRRLGAGRVLGGASLLIAVGLLTVAPAVFVVVYSFVDGPGVVGPGVATDGWERMFASARTMQSILMSLLLSIRVPIGLSIAFLVAWALVRLDIPGRRLIEYTLWFAYFLPMLPMTLGWVLLAHPSYGVLNELARLLPFVDGPIFNIRSAAGIVWVHLTLSTIPIMVLLLRPAFQRVDPAYEEASDVAGVGLMTTLRSVSLPLVLPAVVTAGIAGWIKSLEVFEVEQVLGVPVGIHVYSTRIYNLLSTSPPDFKQAMALSTLFLAVLLVAAAFYQRMLRSRRGMSTVAGRASRAAVAVRTWRTWAAALVLYGALLVGIVLPFCMLVVSSFNRLFGFFTISDPWTIAHWTTVLTDATVIGAGRNSLTVGLLVGGAGTLVYAALAWVLSRARLWGLGAVGFISWLPWAIPGVLLGTAFLSLFMTVPVVTLLVATIVPLTVALLVQTLPLGMHMLRTSIDQISIDLEEASYLSGVGRVRTAFKITMPLVVPTLASVFVLSFMTAVKDISVTVLLARPGTRTLSLLMFEYAAAGRMEPAAIIGVILAVTAVIVTAIMSRFTEKLAIG